MLYLNELFMKLTSTRIVLTSVAVDILDIALNVIVTIITGSVVMLAEALQGVADLICASLAYVAIVRSRKKPDKLHPFGYGKESYFWIILASFLMLTLTAGLTIYFGWQRLLNPEQIDHLWIAIVALVISVFSNGYSLSLSTRRLFAGKTLLSSYQTFKLSALTSVKTTFILDLIGFLAGLIGLTALSLFHFTGINAFDGLGAIGIGLVLATLGTVLLFNLKGFVTGRSAPEEVSAQIVAITEQIDGVEKVLDLKTMHLGSENILVNIEIHADDNLTTDQLEKLIDSVKEELQKSLPIIVHIQVELETP